MPVHESLSDPRSTLAIIYAGGTISSFATASGYREGGHVVDLVEELSSRITSFKKDLVLATEKSPIQG